MISWVSIAPLFMLPTLVVFLIGLLPQVSLLGRELGGGFVRQWFVNQLLAVMPSADARILAEWYLSTDFVGEVLLHGLISININAALLPLLYPIAAFFIGFINWMTTTDLKLKRQSAKR